MKNTDKTVFEAIDEETKRRIRNDSSKIGRRIFLTSNIMDLAIGLLGTIDTDELNKFKDSDDEDKGFKMMFILNNILSEILDAEFDKLEAEEDTDKIMHIGYFIGKNIGINLNMLMNDPNVRIKVPKEYEA